MSTLTQPKLISAQEFFLMPDPVDGSKQELIRGVITTMPPPGGLHGVCCLKVGRKVGNFADDNKRGIVTSNDTGFICERNPDTVRGADISFWSKERLPIIPTGYIEIPPDLAIVVISPSDVFTKVQQKVKQYLERGVVMVWLVAPEDRSVTVYKSLKDITILNENDILSGDPVLPGFACRVSELLP
jgi:Uma2 family endonuclease